MKPVQIILCALLSLSANWGNTEGAIGIFHPQHITLPPGATLRRQNDPISVLHPRHTLPTEATVRRQNGPISALYPRHTLPTEATLRRQNGTCTVKKNDFKNCVLDVHGHLACMNITMKNFSNNITSVCVVVQFYEEESEKNEINVIEEASLCFILEKEEPVKLAVKSTIDKELLKISPTLRSCL